MKKIKKGDKVVRKSYGKDVIFKVTNIIKDEKIAILNGVIERIKADSPIDDLELINEKEVKKVIRYHEKEIEKRLIKSKLLKEDRNYKIGIITKNNKAKEKIITGKILHLDGDRRYSEKSYRYYQKLSLRAIVKNIPEYRQPKIVYKLLNEYKPDILVITGHDGLIKREGGYHDIYNYRNSQYFIETVREARKYEKETNSKLVIFAGACQSYFEAIISAGANFASSPARILIDFLDPLIVAEKVAITEKYKFITIDDIAHELRDGRDGVGGVGSFGTMKKE